MPKPASNIPNRQCYTIPAFCISIDRSGVSLEIVSLLRHTPRSIGLFEPKTKTFFAGHAVCNYNEEFEFYMPPSFPELFEYENYLRSLDKMLVINLVPLHGAIRHAEAA
jgi:glyoxylase-like metal-dependent hydrolase (beta-lactamase superfamily II)